MFEIIQEWFGQGTSLPVIATDVFFVAIGIYMALNIKDKKTVIYVMLTLILLYFVASVAANAGNMLVAICAVFIGGDSVLLLIGCIIGFVIRKLKKKKK